MLNNTGCASPTVRSIVASAVAVHTAFLAQSARSEMMAPSQVVEKSAGAPVPSCYFSAYPLRVFSAISLSTSLRTAAASANIFVFD